MEKIGTMYLHPFALDEGISGEKVATVDEIHLYTGDAEGEIEIIGDNGIEYALQTFVDFNINTVYVFDGAVVFPFLDTYALEKGFKNAQDLKAETGGKRITEEAYDIRGGGTDFYARKIWFKARGKRSNGGNGHERLKAITFYALRPLIPSYSTLQAAIKAFNIKYYSSNFATALYLILKRFSGLYSFITGKNFFNGNKPAGLTIGTLAKNYYLDLKYSNIAPQKRAEQYRRDYKRDGEEELFLRETGLLPSGLLYAKEFNKVYKNFTGGYIYKYDVNSLFPSITAAVGALGKLEKCKPTEVGDDESRYVYIIIFKSLTLRLKNASLPAIFSNPFEDIPTPSQSREVVIINQPFSIFSEYWNILLEYYNVEDFEVYDYAYKARRCKDPAAAAYVHRLYDLKSKVQGEAAKMTVKLFLNNLHGKFAQINYTAPKRCKLIDGVPRYFDGEIVDNFDKKHFDFLRGAYIYAMARVRMLTDIKRLCVNSGMCRMHGYEYIYTDTDSIITTCPPSKFLAISNDLGYYKLEAKYAAFCVYKYKTYIGIALKSGFSNMGEMERIDITAAGFHKEDLKATAIALARESYNVNAFIRDFAQTPIPTVILKRLRGGVAYIETTHTILDELKNAVIDHLEEE